MVTFPTILAASFQRQEQQSMCQREFCSTPEHESVRARGEQFVGYVCWLASGRVSAHERGSGIRLYYRVDCICCSVESPAPSLVPTLRVGMPSSTLRVKFLARQDAERPGMHSHAERGNEGFNRACICQNRPLRALVRWSASAHIRKENGKEMGWGGQKKTKKK
jgi:hypothetical protein